MITKSFNINLDINTSTTKKTSIQLVSNDIDTYTFNISLYNGQVLQDLTTVDHALIFFKRPNNTVIQDTITMSDAGNGKLTYTFINNSSIQYSGTVNAEIEFYNADNTAIMTSSKFSFEVRESINNDGAVQSSSEYSALTTLIQDVDAAETIRIDNENDRIAAENIRVSNEITRESQEALRITAESTRESNEVVRIDAENDRFSAETTRESNENTRIANELTRTTNEYTRISAENDRITSEDNRKSEETIRTDNESSRVSNENARITAEAARVSSEDTRTSNEDNRTAAETLRVSAEDTRVINEDDRNSNELVRIDAEDNRVIAENDRDNAESIRISNESTRNSEETIRVDNEAIRVSNENSRVIAETTRVNSENERISNEDARVIAETNRATAEDTRIANENTRISNEDTRISQEETRQTDTASAIDSLNAAVETTQVIPQIGVSTYTDIATTYPTPLVGWLVHVDDTGKWYRYDGSTWVNTSTYSNEALNVVITNEVNRVDAENSRVTAETNRESNENTRIANELTRISDEDTRISDENIRISNEDTRIGNENTRISNEDTRASQEETRQTDTLNAINSVYTAVSNSQVIPQTGVATYTDIAITYPTPSVGWLVHVDDTGKWYRYDGTIWINTSTYSNEALDALVAQVNIMKKYLPNEVNLQDLEDATQKIQTALNEKGHIILNITGTALIDKLTIYSDTTLEIHGTLKLKDNVNDFMLENEHHASETERNKNITISGGTFDRNTENNTFSVPDEFGYGIFVAFGFNLRNIDSLKLYSNNFM